MRHMMTTAATLSLICGMAAPAIASAPLWSVAAATVIDQDCRNAAIAYLHAAELIRSTGEAEKLQDIDWAHLEGRTNWAGMPEQFKAAHALVPRQAVKAFLAGSRMACSEFYVAREEGIYTLLPHLSQMRLVTRVMRLEARGQLAKGNPDAAAEVIAGIIRMSEHIARDELLICSLVGLSMMTLAGQEAAVLMNSGQATPKTREVLRAAVDGLPQDPYRFRATIAGEREWVLGWIGREFRGADAGARLVAVLGDDWLPSESPDAFRHGIALLDEAALKREIERMDGFYAEVQRIWDAPDAVARLEVLDSRAKRGEFGLMTPFAAAFSKARASADRAEAELAKLRALAEPQPTR